MRARVERVVALWVWTFFVWVLLTWTRTVSQLSFGLGLSLLVAVGCSGLGDVAAPWRLADPRRLVHIGRLAAAVAGRVVRANLVLAWRIWSPKRPLHSGMIIVPTEVTSDGALTSVGVLTSLIVDNQIVDVDRKTKQLQYHAVSVQSEDPSENYESVNGPVERHVRRIVKP